MKNNLIMKRDILIVLGWFALAGYVMARLIEKPGRLDTTLAAWTGGVLSVFFAQLLWRLVQRARQAHAEKVRTSLDYRARTAQRLN